MSSSTSSPSSSSPVNFVQAFPSYSPAVELSMLAEYAAARANLPIPSFDEESDLYHDYDDTAEESSNSSLAPHYGFPPLYEYHTHNYPIASNDFYGVGAHLNSFESHIARLFGFESAMFNITGIQSQLIALKIHSIGRNPIFACHSRSHLLLHELNSYSLIFSLSTCILGESYRSLTFSDIEKSIQSHWKIPSSLILELPDRELGCSAIEFSELIKISDYCREKNISLHLDGARIWEIQPYYGLPFHQLGQLFDSIYISFYKGLNSITAGSMLIGTQKFISTAREWQHRMGGNAFNYSSLAIAAEMAFNQNINSFQRRFNRMKQLVKLIKTIEISLRPSSSLSSSAAAAATITDDSIQQLQLIQFSPSEPDCCQIHINIHSTRMEAESARDYIKEKYHIIIFTVLKEFKEPAVKNSATGDIIPAYIRLYIEWRLGPSNCAIEDKLFKYGWELFIKKLWEIKHENSIKLLEKKVEN